MPSAGTGASRPLNLSPVRACKETPIRSRAMPAIRLKNFVFFDVIRVSVERCPKNRHKDTRCQKKKHAAPRKAFAQRTNPQSKLKFRRSGSPLLASPQGGVAASSRKISRSDRIDAAGVVFLLFCRSTTPASQATDASQYLLIAQPPLLAVMQGGDYRRPSL